MKNKDVDIIVALLEIQDGQVSISQLSKKLKIDYKNTYNIIKRLEKNNLLILNKFGNAYNIILNKKMHPLIFEAEYRRREELLKDKNLLVLYNKLNKIIYPYIALIFGSYSKRSANQYSDIDLMLIYNKSRAIDIERTISLLPLDIHIVTFSFEEFFKMAKNKEFNVVTEAIKNNTIFIGIEDYYRLVENAKP